MAEPKVIVTADTLTAREQEVLELLAQGMSNKQIAVVLVVEDRTVAAHLSNIYAKLDAHTRTAAVVEAQALGLVPSGGELHPVVATIVALVQLRPGSLREAASVLAKGVVNE